MPDTRYRKRNISSFIFPSKNVDSSWNSLYHEIVCLAHIFNKIICLYLIEIAIFERSAL